MPHLNETLITVISFVIAAPLHGWLDEYSCTSFDSLLLIFPELAISALTHGLMVTIVSCQDPQRHGNRSKRRANVRLLTMHYRDSTLDKHLPPLRSIVKMRLEFSQIVMRCMPLSSSS